MKECCGNPRVSVLVPVYNTQEQHLREAIDSILNQSFSDFELILVNDASTDNTVEKVIRSYSDFRIRYYVNTQNMGISGTRNRLIELARGEYLAIMDHDDISYPARFEKEVKYLDANPDVGVVSSAADVLSDKATAFQFPSEDKDIRLGLFEGCIIVHSASMLRKSVLDAHNIRYEEEYSPAEDYALWCRLIPFTKFHNLTEKLFCYRYHSGNTSLVQKEKMDRARVAVQGFVRAENPALYYNYMELAVHETRFKLLGFIPGLKIKKFGRRSTVSFFGVPLLRYKRKSEFFRY